MSLKTIQESDHWGVWTDDSAIPQGFKGHVFKVDDEGRVDAFANVQKEGA